MFPLLLGGVEADVVWRHPPDSQSRRAKYLIDVAGGQSRAQVGAGRALDKNENKFGTKDEINAFFIRDYLFFFKNKTPDYGVTSPSLIV